MNTILKLIEKRGGLEALEKAGRFKIENKPFMDLNIDYLGKGPNGHPMIAVAHNYIQEGDVMADPDMEVEVFDGLRGPELSPVSYQQSALGIFHRIYEVNTTGKIVGFNLELKVELMKFLSKWGTNLKQQGFLKVA